ncbi:MAG: DUF2089 family protein [Prolixibacteraceae bacterium]|jgi:hypothetical protein|nr:DUF2089 family protein [Prolixibacteraceae bacterium]
MRLPVNCPSCNAALSVSTLKCESCQTKVEGSFELPMLAALPPDVQTFIIEFVKNSGSLKKMAKAMSLSYPTVRNRLDEIIELLNETDNPKIE